MMYSRPNMDDATDRLAHMLSEMHNDNTPIGWERYRGLASLLLTKLPIRATVMDPRFFDYEFMPGRDTRRADPGPDCGADMSDELRKLVAVKPLEFPHVAAGGVVGAFIILSIAGWVGV